LSLALSLWFGCPNRIIRDTGWFLIYHSSFHSDYAALKAKAVAQIFLFFLKRSPCYSPLVIFHMIPAEVAIAACSPVMGARELVELVL
jgi:hypothetical protein